MPTEGMVHALENLHQLLKPTGWLIDIHPTGEPPVIEVRTGAQKDLAGWLQESDDFVEYRQADQALVQVVAAGLFAIEHQNVFVFITHAETIAEFEEFLHENWGDAILPLETIQRAETLESAAQGDHEIMMSEWVHSMRLRPVEAIPLK